MHQRMASEHHKVTAAHTIAHAPSTDCSSTTQQPRVVSDPENHQARPWQGPVRPHPSNQFITQRGRFSGQYGGPATRALEPLQFGPSSDFHVRSAPGSFALDNYFPIGTPYSNAAPIRGNSVPSGYVPQMYQPISDRHRSSFHNPQTRGKRNPIKRSSDDARRGGFETNQSHQPFGRRRSSQVGACNFVQSPLQMNAMTQSSNAPPQPRHQYSNATAGEFMNAQHGQQLPPGRYATSSLLGQSGDPLTPRNLAISGSSIMPAGDWRAPIDHRQGSKADDGVPRAVATHEPELMNHPSNPQGFFGQVPNAQTSGQSVQIATVNPHTHSRDPVGSNRQVQSPRTPQRGKFQGSPRKYTKGPKLWIGNLPVTSTRDSVMRMLGHYQGLGGLIDVSKPKPQVTIRMGCGPANCAWVFAE